MKEKILKYIKINKVSTTEVADCLGKSGCVKGISAVNRGHFQVGSVFWAYACDESNWNVHDMIRKVNENDIVFIDAFHCNGRAVLGEIVTKYIIVYKQAAGLVVNGMVRDAHHLIKENYPIWSRGFNPEGCFQNSNYKDISREEYEKQYQKYNGAIAVCDDGGVVLIPKDMHTQDFYEKLEQIEKQEDIWFDCIDRLKWDTYDTICLKKYRDDIQ